MPSINVWGPTTWTLFHTMAEKINETDYVRLSAALFALIKRICAFLPCPECSQHATLFLARIRTEDISTKREFQNMLYLFHNAVNVRKRKAMYNYINLSKYKDVPLSTAFNNFVRVYNTKGNMRLLAESFQRSFIVRDLKYFLVNNATSFSL